MKEELIEKEGRHFFLVRWTKCKSSPFYCFTSSLFTAQRQFFRKFCYIFSRSKFNLPRKMCWKPSRFSRFFFKGTHKMQMVASSQQKCDDDPFVHFLNDFFMCLSELQKTASLPPSKFAKKTKNCISLAPNFWQNGLPAIHRIPNHGLQFSIPLPVRHTKSPQGRIKIFNFHYQWPTFNNTLP